MSDEQEHLLPTIRTGDRVGRREALGTLVACLASSRGAVASPPAATRLATFSADVTPPLGHPLMGGGIAPAREILDPLSARGFVLLGDEYQLLAQRARPDSFVVTMGYGEAGTGYVPTDRHFEEGDTNLDDWCWVAPGSEARITHAITEALRGRS